MNQEELFFETAEEALGAVVAAGGGFKAVGHRLRPELPTDQAGNWLRDCLNPHKRDKLSPGQLVLLLAEGKRVGAHMAMHFLEREAGYALSQPLEPQDERAELQRQFVEAVRQQHALVARMERIAAGASVTPLRSA